MDSVGCMTARHVHAASAGCIAMRHGYKTQSRGGNLPNATINYQHDLNDAMLHSSRCLVGSRAAEGGDQSGHCTVTRCPQIRPTCSGVNQNTTQHHHWTYVIFVSFICGGLGLVGCVKPGVCVAVCGRWATAPDECLWTLVELAATAYFLVGNLFTGSSLAAEGVSFVPHTVLVWTLLLQVRISHFKHQHNAAAMYILYIQFMFSIRSMAVHSWQHLRCSGWSRIVAIST